jgi:ATP-dependent Clp protease ATP-binding subunit ClpB
VLLQILDDGRLTDGQGRTVDFKNTVLIMTSNVGSQWLIASPTPSDESAARERVMDELRASFRPEFLNRVDEIIVFNKLDKDQIARIVDLQFAGLQKRLAGRRISVSLDSSARNLLATEGFDPAYGARPLKRTMQRMVLDPLAVKVLEGEIQDGDSVVVTSPSDHEIVFEKTEHGPASRGNQQ